MNGEIDYVATKKNAFAKDLLFISQIPPLFAGNLLPFFQASPIGNPGLSKIN